MATLNKDADLKESLAALIHDEQWSGWMKYLFDQGGTFNEDGTWTMQAWAVKRWGDLAKTPYSDLPETEKDSVRIEADKVLAVLRHNGPYVPTLDKWKGWIKYLFGETDEAKKYL